MYAATVNRQRLLRPRNIYLETPAETLEPVVIIPDVSYPTHISHMKWNPRNLGAKEYLFSPNSSREISSKCVPFVFVIAFSHVWKRTGVERRKISTDSSVIRHVTQSLNYLISVIYIWWLASVAWLLNENKWSQVSPDTVLRNLKSAWLKRS
jgi:hypothetical protein